MKFLNSMRGLRGRAFAAALALSVTVAPQPASAQDAVSPAAQPTDTAFARQLRAIESVTLAHRLALHGQRARQPLAMVTAAEILLANPTRPLSAQPDSISPGTVVPDPRRLLGTARALAAGDDRLLAIIGPLDQRARAIDRGSAKGPRQLHAQVAATTKREHTVEFRGGEPAVIYVSGDGDSDLDLFVYDASGQLVASSTGPRDECVVRWRPERQGQFRVEVRNLGAASNRYWMVTN